VLVLLLLVRMPCMLRGLCSMLLTLQRSCKLLLLLLLQQAPAELQQCQALIVAQPFILQDSF
jgi:hypothetical protein